MKEILLRHIIKTNPWKINALIWKYIKSSPNGSSYSHLPTFLRVKTDGCVRFVASMETVMITGERRKKIFSSKNKARQKQKRKKQKTCVQEEESTGNYVKVRNVYQSTRKK